MFNKKIKMQVNALELKVGQTEKIAISSGVGAIVGIGLGMADLISMKSWKRTVAENTEIVRELCNKINESSTISDDEESV